MTQTPDISAIRNPQGSLSSLESLLSFSIPDPDAQFFATHIQHDEQTRLRSLLTVLRQVHVAPKKNTACKALAGSLEMSWRTLRQNYYNYTRYGCAKGACHYAPGDWRAVLDWNKVKKSRFPGGRGANRFAFLEFWRGIVENNQRKIKPAWDELIQIIKTGFDFNNRPVKKIPGFDEWPQIDPVLGHPPGMSYANLLNHVSDPYDLSLSRHGRIKGNELRLPVLKTRTKLVFGQYVEFDDHDFNQKTLFQKKPMRPSGFIAMEVLSSCPALMAIKPNLWSFEEQQRLTLTEREFMWFIIAWLTSVGVRRDAVGTTLITERAKAVIRGPFRDRLMAIVPGLRIYAGSIPETNARAPHAGQWAGRGKGNFRTKALIEGFFNPLDNQTASLAGQMGKDRDHSPAQLHGAEKYTKELVNRIESMASTSSIASISAVQFPFLTFHQWRQLAHQALDRLKMARDHKCEGWEKLGFERVLWRPSEESQNWFELSELQNLPDVERQLIAARIADQSLAREQAGSPLTKSVRMSRLEVFNKFRNELKPVPLFHVPELVGRENALNAGAPIPVRKGLFTFECAEIDPDPISFYAADISDGNFLRNDSEWICFVNPCWPKHLIACDDHLRVKAVCPLYERAHDDASLKTAMGKQAQYESAAKVRLDLRHDDAAKRIKEMKAHNDRILDADQQFLSGRSTLNPQPSTAPDSTQELLERATEPQPSEDWS